MVRLENNKWCFWGGGVEIALFDKIYCDKKALDVKEFVKYVGLVQNLTIIGHLALIAKTLKH